MIENNPVTRDDTEAIDTPYDQIVNLVREVGSAMAANNLASVDLQYESLRLSVVANDQSTAPTSAVSQDGVELAGGNTTSAQSPAGDPGLHTVTAPMIGTFYVAPAPNEPPFVTAGDPVEEGQTIGIIEAMKIMNEIASDKQGEIVEVIAKNGETVEFGSPLVTIRVRG